MSKLLTLEELANYLRVTEKTVYRMVDKKIIPATRVGRQWRFNQDTIDGWLQQNSTEISASILIIDDDEDIRLLFKDTLEAAGHTLTAAARSDAALNLIREQSFDLVFLDLMLPGVDGAKVFQQIRDLQPDLPVTIITGYPDSDLMMKALEYGPLGAMKKPFKSSDILAAVSNYVRFNRLSK